MSLRVAGLGLHDRSRWDRHRPARRQEPDKFPPFQIGPGIRLGDHRAAIYGRPPAEPTEAEFIRLAAVLIAPASYDLTRSDAKLDERAARIQRLAAGACEPASFSDDWLEGCR